MNQPTTEEATRVRTRHRAKSMGERLGFTLAAVACAWALLAAAPGLASVRHPELARKAWAHAVELQRALAARPSRLRRPANYERVIREYHMVYFYDYAYVKAPVAAEMMGDLYSEMGRRFHNPGYYRLAIKSYDYVRSQYPGSTMARDSALSAGKVYLEGLHDPDQARDTYREFIAKYPTSLQAREAGKRLRQMAALQNAPKEQPSREANLSERPDRQGSRAGGPVKVTDIHDWVGPDYTRVVIGAKGPFKYNTLRLSHPDRIVFDLPDTHVSRVLLRKKVRTDGAFLRDIRVGQFKPNVTRIVLDVKNLNDYSAFPLPNPYRLIIDVHGTSSQMAEQSAPSVKPAVQTTANHISATPAAMTEYSSPAEPQATRSDSEAMWRIRKIAHSHTAIAYPDQAAVVAAAESQSRQHAPKVEKAKSTAVSVRLTAPAERKKAESSVVHHVEPAARSKTDIATSPRPQQKAKARIVEVASNETKPLQIPISTRPAKPIDGSQTLTRALGLKVERIVIDPGHGGFDTGCIGPDGLEEKNVVLNVALRLRKLFETRTNYKIFMTRSTDKFIPLEERTAIANADHADLFISIHANASPDHHVRGIATYFLNFTSDPEALQLAARENATSQESVYQLQSLIKKIALNNKIEESQQLAKDVQTSLYRRMSRISPGIHNRGVRKAPFVVLIGANMPSILAEISFVTNPKSEHLLRQGYYREDIAKALFNGIEAYIHNLGSVGNVRVAQRTQ